MHTKYLHVAAFELSYGKSQSRRGIDVPSPDMSVSRDQVPVATAERSRSRKVAADHRTTGRASALRASGSMIEAFMLHSHTRQIARLVSKPA